MSLLIPKWKRTGLLDDVEENKLEEAALWLENEAKRIIDTYNGSKKHYISPTIVLPDRFKK